MQKAMKTLKKYPVTILLLLFFINGNAQVFTPKWETCLGGTEWDEATDILMVDSSYWVVAETKSTDGDISYNHGNKDVWLLNLDMNGNLISEKTFGGTRSEGSYTRILQLNDSVFYIVPSSNSSDGDITYNPWPGNLPNYWVLQINNQGDILWDRVCGGSDIDNTWDAVVTADGGIIALGESVSTDGDVVDHHGFGSYDIWLIKLGVNGTKQWTLSLGGDGNASAGSIIQTVDGGYMVVGETDGIGGGNYDTTCNFHNIGSRCMDVWLVKLDSAGTIEWQQCYGGSGYDFGNNIIELPDGYIVLGSTMSNDGDVSGFHGTSSGYNGDIWVFKIDKSGNLLWQRCLGGSYWDFARNIFPTTDGGYMIVGTTNSSDGDVSGHHGFPGYEWYTSDVWFAKIDSIGNLLWQYCYGGLGDEFLYRGVIQKSDWDYVLAIGTTTTEWRCYFGPHLRPDVRIAELYDSTLVGIKEEPSVKEEWIRVFPNPAGNTVTFSYTLPVNTVTGIIELFDNTGKTVKRVNITRNTSQTVDCSAMPTGVYYYRVTAGRASKTGKLVIQH